MSAPNDPSRSLSRLLAEISRQLSQDFAGRVQDFGLTHTQSQALTAIAQNAGLKQAELAGLLRVKPMSAGRLVDRMEAAGWVERRRSTEDRRIIHLYVTEQAQPLLADLGKAATRTRQAAFSDFEAGERDQLIALLERVKANLQKRTASSATKSSRRGANS